MYMMWKAFFFLDQFSGFSGSSGPIQSNAVIALVARPSSMDGRDFSEMDASEFIELSCTGSILLSTDLSVDMLNV